MTVQRVARALALGDNASTRRTGAGIAAALVVIVVLQERGLVGPMVGQGLAILLIAIGLATVSVGSQKLERLSELYLWLAFILSIYHLHVVAQGLAELTGWADIDVFRWLAVAHLLLVVAALWALGAWGNDEPRVPSGLLLPRVAAALFIVGAVVFWVGARTFPGMALQQVHANQAGHLWTALAFLIAAVITVAGLALLTIALRDAGDRILSTVGFTGFLLGAVLWILHLAFRMTVMVQAAQEFHATGMSPPWFEPWRQWAAALFAIYSVLAYLALAAYGGALLKVGWLPRWIGWTCVCAGAVAAPLGGLPLFIHVPLWLVGILVLQPGPRDTSSYR